MNSLCDSVLLMHSITMDKWLKRKRILGILFNFSCKASFLVIVNYSYSSIMTILICCLVVTRAAVHSLYRSSLDANYDNLAVGWMQINCEHCGSLDMDLWSQSWGSVSAAGQLEVRVITLHYTQTVYCKLPRSKLKACVVTAELQTGRNEM